jgi:hypothetical protein
MACALQEVVSVEAALLLSIPLQEAKVGYPHPNWSTYDAPNQVRFGAQNRKLRCPGRASAQSPKAANYFWRCLPDAVAHLVD